MIKAEKKLIKKTYEQNEEKRIKAKKRKGGKLSCGGKIVPSIDGEKSEIIQMEREREEVFFFVETVLQSITQFVRPSVYDSNLVWPLGTVYLSRSLSNLHSDPQVKTVYLALFVFCPLLLFSFLFFSPTSFSGSI